ncbi:hypothetical protein ABZ348_01420 [Streptomyces sp. NPDC005963]|uniref:hypothetical protein n=1 Tax=Streptomyces sp. NPDC005963 TaxID=3156721 RepID=UPI0034118E2A
MGEGMTDVSETLAKMLKATVEEVVGEKSDGNAKGSSVPPTVPSEPPVATDMSLDPGGLNSVASKARESYEKTCMWILSVFAAFGLLIFGSLPFTNIGRVEGSDRDWLWAGLVLASAGIAIVVIAATVVFGPVITSLGILAEKLETIKDPILNPAHPPEPSWCVRAFKPRKTAVWVLRNMLEGNESRAHLGPRVTTVRQLIEKLGDFDEMQLSGARAEAGKRAKLAALDKAVEAHLTTVTALKERLVSIGDPKTDRAAKTLQTAVLATLSHEVRAAAMTARQRAAMARMMASAAQRLAECNTDMQEYLGHRQLVLAEANVLLMRANFRLARKVIVLGAACTLVGAALYASVLPATDNDDDNDNNNEKTASTASWDRYINATVEVRSGTAAARQLPAGCTDRKLAALRVAEDAAPQPAGPYTVVITTEGCRGTVTVPVDQGTIDSPALP